MNEACFEYKCRRCGKRIGDGCVSKETAERILFEHVIGIKPKPTIGVFCATIIHSDCYGYRDDERYLIKGQGIADLIGFRIKE